MRYLTELLCFSQVVQSCFVEMFTPRPCAGGPPHATCRHASASGRSTSMIELFHTSLCLSHHFACQGYAGAHACRNPASGIEVVHPAIRCCHLAERGRCCGMSTWCVAGGCVEFLTKSSDVFV
ncbi:hypothetical protein P153DRAFT_175109 [Dothidotthia symphoricarpi CBS 119687]|uniref:Uncharacterized protein n=1 Tax=Dothidotthia symphoricarpi CBS 119687 TaxID=1392245 RepID=A0A6A6AP71_9PLEO|nr:uncharacterized protein P153DRAFT_175109 [Dothidotthia symphoricarpi CBS 119687]KAF2132845.1 hypothetical protein P153DRAFT_175109 [Dothidotthia symphoricarpi CBS 119687]